MFYGWSEQKYIIKKQEYKIGSSNTWTKALSI